MVKTYTWQSVTQPRSPGAETQQLIRLWALLRNRSGHFLLMYNTKFDITTFPNTKSRKPYTDDQAGAERLIHNKTWYADITHVATIPGTIHRQFRRPADGEPNQDAVYHDLYLFELGKNQWEDAVNDPVEFHERVRMSESEIDDVIQQDWSFGSSALMRQMYKESRFYTTI